MIVDLVNSKGLNVRKNLNCRVMMLQERQYFLASLNLPLVGQAADELLARLGIALHVKVLWTAYELWTHPH